MKIIIAIAILLSALFFAHMRFACTGTYSKSMVRYQDETGKISEIIRCNYKGWKNFRFQIFTRGVEPNVLIQPELGTEKMYRFDPESAVV